MKTTVKILGNRIDCFAGYEQLYGHVRSRLQAPGCAGYITVNNVHTMMEGYWHPEYQAIINESYLAIPDGKPLQILGKVKGQPNATRLFGPTVMEKFIDWGRSEGLTHFFLGSSESNLDKLRTVINQKYPSAKIVGMIAPPFKPVAAWNNSAFIEAINEAKPDFIWVGLGAPKQERWMHSQYRQVRHGVMVGIGAGFDYMAGNTKHAPEWMKNASLEWLYRLTQEPKRLWKRYLMTIPPFLILASLELLGEKLGRKEV